MRDPAGAYTDTQRTVTLAIRSEVISTAVCDDDRCPWKHRGVTPEATAQAAALHVMRAAHNVTLRTELRVSLPDRAHPDGYRLELWRGLPSFVRLSRSPQSDVIAGVCAYLDLLG